MQANAISILNIFESKMQLEVPLFQRQYVWSKNEQWEPLWEDISRKFTDYLEAVDSPIHFLGAIVLDQKQTPIAHVERRQIIDGQQRLTTFQIFLASLGDFCREHNCDEIAEELVPFTRNRGMMANPETESYKVWPTQHDRDVFKSVMMLGSRQALEAHYPLQRIKYARKNKFRPRPRMVEAYLYFYEQIEEYFLGSDELEPIYAQVKLSDRLEECFRALRNALQVVAIDLEQGDDPQIIFESLNARGAPLLPADLLRNYIFLRASRETGEQERLYSEYWLSFDEQFWRQEERQGRLKRPRSDLFMQHFLASRLTRDIPAKNLYAEYKHWIERDAPFASVETELQSLANQREDFRRILERPAGDVISPLAEFLNTFDVRTVYPLLLYLFERNISSDRWVKISQYLESFLLRRAVCGWTTKSYNRIFLSMTRTLKSVPDEDIVTAIFDHISGMTGETVQWPNDHEFSHAWQTMHAYQNLSHSRIVYILRKLSDKMYSKKSERISIETGDLSVEHIMPQSWITNWPLPDGSQGMTRQEFVDAEPGDARAVMTDRRDRLIHTFGNLTLLNQPLNSEMSNSDWQTKRAALDQRSLLPLNLELRSADSWDEGQIEERSRKLLAYATEIWEAPGVRLRH